MRTQGCLRLQEATTSCPKVVRAGPPRNGGVGEESRSARCLKTTARGRAADQSREAERVRVVSVFNRRSKAAKRSREARGNTTSRSEVGGRWRLRSEPQPRKQTRARQRHSETVSSPPSQAQSGGRRGAGTRVTLSELSSRRLGLDTVVAPAQTRSNARGLISVTL